MNIFDNISPETLKKVYALLNSRQGEELKMQMQSINKDKLIEMVSKMNVTAEDISKLSSRMNNLTEEDISLMLNKLKGGK